MCVDVMKSVCSQAKVLSMIADFKKLHSGKDGFMERLLSMDKAISTLVCRIQSDFQEYSDVAEPFLAGVMQVNLDIINICFNTVWSK